jgi:hypothetical protein
MKVTEAAQIARRRGHQFKNDDAGQIVAPN